jgi:hypothetical protein
MQVLCRAAPASQLPSPQAIGKRARRAEAARGVRVAGTADRAEGELAGGITRQRRRRSFRRRQVAKNVLERAPGAVQAPALLHLFARER